MAIFKIPAQAETTDQTLDVELNETPYIIRILWNERFGYFSFSLMTADNEPILTNVKMVKNHPLMQRFKDELLPPGEFYFIQAKGNSERPVYSDLAVTHDLYYVEEDEAFTPELILQAIV